MRKFAVLTVLTAATACVFACGCAHSADYSEYISEMRYNIYVYEDENTQIKLYKSKKEAPFVADGIKGKVSELTEIYFKTSGEPETVSLSSSSFTGGEMSYITVRECWYLSFGGETTQDGDIDITINADGEEKNYTLSSVVNEGVMSCESALKCVEEHDAGLFEELTENGYFNGEIFIRLLHDEKCYYYVGICNREGKINSYLVDGESGRIIAEREHSV